MSDHHIPLGLGFRIVVFESTMKVLLAAGERMISRVAKIQ